MYLQIKGKILIISHLIHYYLYPWPYCESELNKKKTVCLQHFGYFQLLKKPLECWKSPLYQKMKWILTKRNPELSQKNVKVVYQVLGWQSGIVELLKWTV